LIGDATETVRQWQPRAEPLTQRICRAFELADPRQTSGDAANGRALLAVNAVSSGRASPLDLRGDIGKRWSRQIGDHLQWLDGPMRNYLAARLFGNWVAYQGRGLRTVVEWLRACAAVLRSEILERVARPGEPPAIDTFIEAVRAADLRLLHVVDSSAFARHVAEMEGPDPR
jgi:hypothetical protein